MKPGDEFAVNMEGFHVTNGVIEEIDGDTVTVFIPATRVKMGIRAQLTDLTPEVDREFGGLVEDARNDEPSEAAKEQIAAATQQQISQNDMASDPNWRNNLDSSAVDKE